jgi:hypothetical protein
MLQGFPSPFSEDGVVESAADTSFEQPVVYIHRLSVNALSVQTRYENRRLFDGPRFNGPPAGWKPCFVYLLARHGERFPTEKRIQNINTLPQLLKVWGLLVQRQFQVFSSRISTAHRLSCPAEPSIVSRSQRILDYGAGNPLSQTIFPD